MRHKVFAVYILAGASRTLYVGVTSDLARRVCQHKKKLKPGFTRRYNVDRLVYWETLGDATTAIRREKAIKGWIREKKVALIESRNPAWTDLAAGWFSPPLSSKDRRRPSS